MTKELVIPESENTKLENQGIFCVKNGVILRLSSGLNARQKFMKNKDELEQKTGHSLAFKAQKALLCINPSIHPWYLHQIFGIRRPA